MRPAALESLTGAAQSFLGEYACRRATLRSGRRGKGAESPGGGGASGERLRCPTPLLPFCSDTRNDFRLLLEAPGRNSPFVPSFPFPFHCSLPQWRPLSHDSSLLPSCFLSPLRNSCSGGGAGRAQERLGIPQGGAAAGTTAVEGSPAAAEGEAAAGGGGFLSSVPGMAEAAPAAHQGAAPPMTVSGAADAVAAATKGGKGDSETEDDRLRAENLMLRSLLRSAGHPRTSLLAFLLWEEREAAADLRIGASFATGKASGCLWREGVG